MHQPSKYINKVVEKLTKEFETINLIATYSLE